MTVDGRVIVMPSEPSGHADIGHHLRQVYWHIARENLPQSIFHAVAALERQLEDREGT